MKTTNKNRKWLKQTTDVAEPAERKTELTFQVKDLNLNVNSVSFHRCCLTECYQHFLFSTSDFQHLQFLDWQMYKAVQTTSDMDSFWEYPSYPRDGPLENHSRAAGSFQTSWWHWKRPAHRTILFPQLISTGTHSSHIPINSFHKTIRHMSRLGHSVHWIFSTIRSLPIYFSLSTILLHPLYNLRHPY